MAEDSDKKRQFNHNVIIVVVLVVQALLPLRYYVGDDPFDERFAWRMFSPIRMVRCDSRWSEGADRQPLNVASKVHIVWHNLMRRARMDVVDGFAARRCGELEASGDSPQLYTDMRCVMPDGTPMRPVPLDRNLCEVSQ